MTAAWCFEEQSTAYTETVLRSLAEGAAALVPRVWSLEVVNMLVVAERRRKILPSKTVAFIRELQGFPIAVDDELPGFDFDSILDIARRYQRSAYDASYLELALRLNLPLATKDEPLRKAAGELKVPLYLGQNELA